MAFRLSTDFMNGAVTRVLLLFGRPSYMRMRVRSHLMFYSKVDNVFQETVILNQPSPRFTQVTRLHIARVEIECFRFVVDICDLVHDVEAIFHLP